MYSKDCQKLSRTLKFKTPQLVVNGAKTKKVVFQNCFSSNTPYSLKILRAQLLRLSLSLRGSEEALVLVFRQQQDKTGHLLNTRLIAFLIWKLKR